ncbi:mitochondrial enolase superfamily member 1 [Grus japonensis]|uniref:Mitochondrial enolase superfamily member 1 n=1 Tax=Grus japonensis TaxID=30415 RepID=A0ABC9W8P8_GRUJA
MFFEQSWQLGEVPKDWKKANDMSIFKKGKKEDPGNYMPVSLTSILRKSFLTNSITFYDEITGLVDEGRAVDIVYLDFNKAFDTDSHNFFTEKLMKYGLDE